MTDNKKSGIRLRHLEQQSEAPEIRREASPNNVSRKKIFERLPEPRSQNKVVIEEPVKVAKTQPNEFNSSKQFQQIVEALKKKSMELELRDNMIKSLNREIDGLTKQLHVKEKHISKLILQIERLERLSSLAREITSNEGHSFQSFRDPPENNAFMAPQQQFTASNEANPQRKRVGSTLPSYPPKEDISLFNINSGESPRQEILSPFMALNSKKNDSAFESQITVKQKDSNRRTSTNKLPNAFEEQSAFKKKAQFDVWKGNDRKISTSNVGTRQLQKFDLFGQNEYKSQIRQKGPLQIDNSRQFKFQDFDPNEFQDFGENSY